MGNFNETNKPMSSNTTGKKKSSLRDKAGELLEKAGEKISDAGATNIGRKIHDLGDKVETTHEEPNHPKDV